MAVTLKGQTAVYEGTSTDTKPTDADNNAIFKELDTGIRYYYDGTDWNEIPRSGGGGGGGTGTDDYTDLNNKPKVNNVTVVGNLTSSDLKLQGEITSSHKLSADLVDDSTSTNKFNVQADWDQTINSAPDYIKNKPTLGTAAAKNATDTYNATGTDVTTGKAVAAALATLPEPMVFKGSLGTGGTITTLPTASSSNKGYVYKVITVGTYASQSAKVGDTFISDGSAWVLIPSGDEPGGTVTNVAVDNGGGLIVSGSPVTSSGTITVGHSNSVTAKTSSSLKKFTYDANGHVTGSSELSTAESDALASGIDSTKVAQIETNKNNILSLDEEANALANNDRKNIITLHSFPMIVSNVTITQDLLTGELVFNGTASGTGYSYAYVGAVTVEAEKVYGFIDPMRGKTISGTLLYSYIGSASLFSEEYPGFFNSRANRTAIAGGKTSIVVRLSGGTTYSDCRLSPMLFAGEITDNTYRPPAETNAHLTQQLQYAQFRRITTNSSSVTFNLIRTDNANRFRYGFVLLGDKTDSPAIYAMLIGDENANPTVSFTKIGGGIEVTLTGSVVYDGYSVAVTITSTSTLYGGIRLIWLD